MIDLSPLKPALKGKPLAVVGLGKSGLPVFEAARAAGIETVLWDDNPASRAVAGGVIEDLSAADFSRFSALILAPGIPLTHPVPHPCALRAKEAGVAVIGDIELFHRARPRARTIGITGTNGKSTTTALIGHILKEAGMPCAVGGNIGDAVLTLPNLDDGAVYVIEMSSYQVDLCTTFAPVIAAHINFSPDHLDRHGGMDGYIAAKERMFRGEGIAVIGIDDAWSEAMCARVKTAGRRKVVTVSCLKDADMTVTADGILLDRGQKIADLKSCSGLKGAHNWQNAGIAHACCSAAGVSAEKIAAAMKTFPGLAHRQKITAEINGVLYINDSKATNDQAAAMALKTFDPVYWIAGGRPKEGGYGDCEQYLSHVRHAFLIGEAQEAMAAWLSSKSAPHTRCGTLEKALAAAHAMAQGERRKDAAVLLSPACASWDQFKSFEHRGDVFTALVQTLAKEEAA